MAACTNARRPVVQLHSERDTIEVGDSTVYGIIGEETAMHTLQVIATGGDTLQYLLNADEEPNIESSVMGGLLAGDRVAVCGSEIAGELTATKVINLTTLLGRWTSMARSFTIEEDGSVQGDVKVETRPWTSWRIANGQLLLGKDTFDIVGLGADSLYIENSEGIFAYKRM